LNGMNQRLTTINPSTGSRSQTHLRFLMIQMPLPLRIFGKNEQRYVTIGMDAFGRILVVVYTWRDENIRIISARKAVRYEVKQYESEI